MTSNNTSANNTNNNSWQPEQKKIKHIIELITFTQLPDTQKQKQVFDQFNLLQQQSEFPAYVAIIFANTNLSLELRRSAGLLLKESLRRNLTNTDIADSFIESEVLSICKECLLDCLISKYSNLDEKFMSSTSAIAIVSIVRETSDTNLFQTYYQQNDGQSYENPPFLEFDAWPELLQSLLQLLNEHQDEHAIIETILYAIAMLAEDCSFILGYCKESESLISALLSFSASSNIKTREYCLKSLFFLFQFQPNSLLKQISVYSQVVLKNMADTENEQILKIIAESVISMCNEFWSYFKSATTQIFEYMLFATQSDFESLSEIAGEFWSLYATDPSPEKPNAILIDFLPQLVPTLIQRCRYTNDALSAMDFDNDAQSIPDKAENMLPKHYRSRHEHDGHGDSHARDGDAMHDVKRSMDLQLGHGMMLDAEEISWNIRKCAAHQLELLSRVPDIKPPLMATLLSEIEQGLASENFLDREACLAALGAVTETSADMPQLSTFVPFLMQQTTHHHLLVRQIAHWVLMRISDFYNTEQGTEFFEPVLGCFLNGMKDDSKRVQRAACGSLAMFVIYTNNQIVQQKYIESLMNTFLWGFQNYHLCSFAQLIDVIIQTTEVIATEPSGKGRAFLCMKEVQDALLPPIIDKWGTLESMSTVVLGTRINDEHNDANTEHNHSARRVFDDNGNGNGNGNDNHNSNLNVVIDNDGHGNANGNADHEESQVDDDDGTSIAAKEKEERRKQKEYDTNIFPLFEAIARWTQFIGQDAHFQAVYMQKLYVHALDLAMATKGVCQEYEEAVAEARQLFATANENNDEQLLSQEIEDSIELDEPNKEFWVCSLDLMAVLMENCQPQILSVLWNTDADASRLLMVVYSSVEQDNFHIRRNALALLGDLFQYLPQKMVPYIDRYLPLVISNIVYEWKTVCSNAQWVVGQCLKHFEPALLEKYCEDVLNKLVTVLKVGLSDTMAFSAEDPYANTELYAITHAAITLAILIDSFPDEIIANCDAFMVEWISALTMCVEDETKAKAFKTLLVAVMTNPNSIVGNPNGCKALFEGMARWDRVPPELDALFQNILVMFKKASPDWEQTLATAGDEAVRVLKQRYNV